MRRHSLPLTILAMSLIACSPQAAHSCSIPVFRYALEHWTADPLILHVFHRGPLTTDQTAWLDALGEQNLDGDPIANLRLETVDLDADLDETAAALWNRYQSDALPHLLLQQPASTVPPEIVWNGPLTEQSLQTIHDSPLRQTIARQLLEGKSVVWVLLESGDASLDDAAWGTLTTELERLEQTLELSPIDPQDAAELTIEPTALKLSFAAHRLSRETAIEAAFCNLLLSVEPDLRDAELLTQPMVFPIFGRGRALYALVGEGISRETIEDAARFLTTGCQCTVKRDNPGADLLFAVDWSRYVEPTVPLETKLPPLVGLEGFGKPSPTGDSIASVLGTPEEAGHTSTPGTGGADNHPGGRSESSLTAPSPPVTATPAPPASLWDAARLPVLVVVGLVILGTLLVTRRGAG